MVLNWKQVTFLAVAFSFAAGPVLAQRSGGGMRSGGGAPSGGNAPILSGAPELGVQPMSQPGTMQPLIGDSSMPRASIVEDENCLPWALSSIRGATVSVMRLQVPDKARSEYDKACSDFRKKKFAEAEEHIRGAIEKYSNYVAAWVMMGEVLEAEQQVDKAHEACSHASAADPTYLPPYICLAELDARSGHWDELLNVTNSALGLNPVGDMYAYFYRATAFFNTHKLAEAERKRVDGRGHGSRSPSADHPLPVSAYLRGERRYRVGHGGSEAVSEVQSGQAKVGRGQAIPRQIAGSPIANI